MFDTLVVIPAYNEEKNITKVLEEIKSTKPNFDVVVIDDGSTDKTKDFVKKAGYSVISLPYNLGYGAALQTGFKYAAMQGYNYVVQFDADGQHNPVNIKTIIDKLHEYEADIVIGSRFLNNNCKYKTPLLKIIAITLFRFLIKVLTGNKITDPTSGLQGLSRRVFTYYSIKGNFPGDYPDADVLIHMLRCKYRVCEFAADIRPRNNGKSMHSGIKPLYYFLKLTLSIIIVIMREKLLVERCGRNELDS